MNPQVTYRKFGILAAVFTLWLIIHQIMAFVVAVVMASTCSSYNDESATVMYLVLSGFGWMLGIVCIVLSGFNLVKDPKGKWLGVVSIFLTLGTLVITTIIGLLAAVDTWS
ncbi:MAG: hypothetical protein ACD_43C00269G0005 [uncultured bacterium]|nr:MAG: hypothetical protein ACD_43C00269G0005 [uncultured bacterium]